jgi:fructose-1,6-bisphosphatase I
VFAFTLDPTFGEFVLTHEDIKIPKTGKIYSFNEGNYDLWDGKLQSYLGYLRQPGPPNGKPYSGRYIGCLVGEIHRMLLYGGIYGNPKNKNSKNGNLRLLYECAPMSYLVEQAGGKATDGHQRILDIKPEQVLISLQLHHFILDWNFINLDSKKKCVKIEPWHCQSQNIMSARIGNCDLNHIFPNGSQPH